MNRSLRAVVFQKLLLIDYIYMKTRSSDLCRRCQSVAGLSYVEVMVSTITTAIFLSTTLQAYVAATGIRVRSQQVNAAISVIQADAEALRQMAQAIPTSENCQLSPSDSYVQRMMTDVIAKDTAAYGVRSETVISAIEQKEGQSVLQQSSTLPLLELQDNYRLLRNLSVDKSVPPSAQVLQVSYQVLRQSTSSLGDEDTEGSQPLQIPSETPIAQLHTSIIPNAALVCF